MSIKAIKNISQVRGGSQARIMLADDGKKYVVKFMGNPQSTRVLANDYLACRLARMIGLSVPEPVIILVDEETIVEQQITFTLAGRAVAACPGHQFGSVLVTGEVWDWPRINARAVQKRGSLLVSLLSTNGPAMPMVDRSYSTRRRTSGNSVQSLSTLAIASMLGNGVSPTRRCVACMPSMRFMRVSNHGTTLRLGLSESSDFRERTAVHCGGDALRVVWRAFRTAAPAELLVGAAQHGSWASRRFQDLKQKPFSELDRGTSGTLRDRSQWRTQGHVRSAPLANP